MPRRHKNIRPDPLFLQYFFPFLNHAFLFFIRYARILGKAVQGKASPFLGGIPVILPMLRNYPALPVQLTEILPEVFPGRIHTQIFIPVIRHHADQRADTVPVEQLLQRQEIFPVHICRNIIHSNRNLHT